MPILLAVKPTRYNGVLYAPGETFDAPSATDALVLTTLGHATEAPSRVPDPRDVPERKRRKRSEALDETE
jgi:hypothetical protein